MGKRIWRTFNFFIYSPKIRCKYDSTILIGMMKLGAAHLLRLIFFSTPMATSLSKYIYLSSRLMTIMGKAFTC